MLVANRNHDARLRFEREARVLAKLEHPNIVRVIDVGDDASLPFLVLERLEGETLAQRLEREGALPIPLAIRFTIEVLSALSAAHAQGVIHRDLKPANVFLVTKAGTTSVRVLDFGVAKLVHGTDRLRTETGSMLGTPAHMAPEQLLATRAIDARADVHAAGALLFEMLTGRRPFVGDRIALATAILVEDRPRADALADVPPALADVIAKAMARRSEDRFRDAASMAHALESATKASPRTFGTKRIFAMGLLSALSVGLLGAAALLARRAPAPEHIASEASVPSSAPPDEISEPDPAPPLASSREEVESGVARASCVCAYYVQGRWGAPLCPEKQTPRCTCNGAAGVLCRFVRSSADTSCKDPYTTFSGADLKTGDACKGYAFTPTEAVPAEGTLECSVCWKTVHQAGTHRAPCRGLDHKGRPTDGAFYCR